MRPSLHEIPAAGTESHELDRRTWRNWLMLLGTSIVATAGLGAAIAPLVAAQSDSIWPWSWTSTLLLGALSLTVTTLGWYLTLQQRRLTALRQELQQLQASELARAREHATLLDQANRELNLANAELGTQIRERERIAVELRSLNETLEIRVAERSAAAERHAEELRQAKESLEERNQRLLELYKAAHRFVDNVSHEFRTPLTVIKEYAAAAREELPVTTSAGAREHLDIVLQRVDDLTVMVNDILDLSRIEADILRTSRRPCLVAEIVARVRDVLERKATAGRVALDVDVEAPIPDVYCDPEKIGRVIVNLAVNAIKFSREGASVRLWARYEPGAPAVVVGVTDQGPGIAPENLGAIFERFKQFNSSLRTSSNGFGLGLNIVKELVQLNFGEVHVDSELDEGSTFTFTIPLAEPACFVSGWLEHVRRMPRSASCVSLLRASADAAGDAASADEVELFLEGQMRRTDLVLRAGDTAWFVAAASQDGDSRPLVERLEQALDEVNRARPSSPLPRLGWSIVGTWGLDVAGDGLVHAMAASPVFPDGGVGGACDAGAPVS